MRDARGHLTDCGHLLGSRERFTQREHPLVAVDELLVAQPQLGGGFVDPLLQRFVEVLQALQHVVEPVGDAANFVGPRPFARAR